MSLSVRIQPVHWAKAFPSQVFTCLRQDFWTRLISVHMKLHIFMTWKVALQALQEQCKERKNAEWALYGSSALLTP